jgi:hypothetical protein
MKKMINILTGKEVKFGEVVTFEKKEPLYEWKIKVTLDPHIAEDLIEGGLIKIEEEIDFSDVIDSLVERYNISHDYFDIIVSWLEKSNVGALLNIYLREVAMMLDDKYEDHISKSEKLFVVDSTNGVIKEIPKDNIITYNTFAAFRTYEDALLACKALKPVFKGIYGKKQK